MLTYVNSIQFALGEPVLVSLRNFYEPENEFVWSSSRWSEITFSFSATPEVGAEEADVILDCDVFKVASRLEGQNILTYLNGARLGSHFITQRTLLSIRVGASQLKPTANVLTLDTPDSRKPSEFGSADDRQLGIQLFSIRIRPVEKPEICVPEE